jgi:hypothetical protein
LYANVVRITGALRLTVAFSTGRFRALSASAELTGL